MKLYELSDAYSQAIALYNEAETDEDQQTALNLLQQIEEPFEEKVDNVCKILKSIEAEKAGYDAEIERLQQHAKSAGNRHANLKAYLKEALENSGLPEKKVKTKLFSVRIQNNPPSVQVLCPDSELPAKYKIIVPATIQVDKKAILADYKAGEQLPSSITIEVGTHLRYS